MKKGNLALQKKSYLKGDIMENAHVFIKIEEYQEVLDTISLIKEKLQEAKNTLNKINNIKSKEDAEIDSWNQKLMEAESKIQEMDSKLLNPEE